MAVKDTIKKTSEQLKLYIGIDVHLKSWHVTICSSNMTLQSFTQPPNTKALLSYLTSRYPEYSYYSVYESGFSGFWIHRELVSLGIKNIVVNASDVPTTDKEKRHKRDKIDSLKLSKTLRSGILEGIYVPSVKEQGNRSLLRVRKQLVKDISRYKNRIKSHLYYKGIEIPPSYLRSSGYWSKAFKSWLKQCPMATKVGFQALNYQLESMFYLQEKLIGINRFIRDLSKTSDFKSNMDLITSIPGVGVLSGMIILTEIGDINRFKRIDHLNSFVGFIPNVYSSGDKELVGSLTKRGNNYLRTTIIECSWWAIRKDPSLTLSYEKLCNRMKPSKAIIRIARKLLSRIRYVLVNKQPYVLGVAA